MRRASPGDVFVCGVAARWLPRVLAASVLVAAWLVAQRVDPQGTVPGSGPFRMLLVVFGAAAALWIVRQGGELRLRVRLTEQALIFEGPRGMAELPLGQVDGLRFDLPFASSRSWLPATVLLDREQRPWRLSAMLDGGDRLVGGMLERLDRDDLRTWAEVLRLERRMGASGPRVAIGYGAATSILAAALFYLLH